MKKRYAIFIGGILVCTFAIILIFNSNHSNIELNFVLSKTNIENVSELSLFIISSEDRSDLIGKIVLPNEIELVKGDLNWEGDLIKDVEEKLSVQIKTKKEGKFEIQGFAGENLVQAEIDINFSREPRLAQRLYPTKEYEEPEYDSEPRTWLVPTINGDFIPEPLKEDDFNNYFKNLNLVEENIYVLIQFEGEEGNPDPRWVKILEKDGVRLFDWYGDHVYNAIIPKKFLEEKSYDFIRWADVKDCRLKLPVELREKIKGNCSGKLDALILFHEDSNKEQLKKIEEISGEEINIDNFEDMIRVNLDIGVIKEVAKLGFVEKIELVYLPNICPPMKNGGCTTNPLENIICY